MVFGTYRVLEDNKLDVLRKSCNITRTEKGLHVRRRVDVFKK